MTQKQGMKQKLQENQKEAKAPAPEKPVAQENTTAEEAAKWKEVALRAAAEAENVKKRAAIDVEKANRYAVGSFAKSVLPVMDSLEQAIGYAAAELEKEKQAGKPVSPVLENLLKGVQMTAENLKDALNRQQIQRIESLGRVFDPNFHKVIQELPDPTKPAGSIVQELQAGYTIGGDRVLREAMVVVTK